MEKKIIFSFLTILFSIFTSNFILAGTPIGPGRSIRFNQTLYPVSKYSQDTMTVYTQLLSVPMVDEGLTTTEQTEVVEQYNDGYAAPSYNMWPAENLGSTLE